MEKSKRNYIVLIIGVIVLIAAIILLVNGIKQKQQQDAEYQIAYDAWHKAWWEDHTASLEDMPKRPGVPVLLIFGPIGIFLGLALTGTGLAVAFGKETQDIIEENAKQATTFFANLNNNTIRPQKRICKYCGSENKPEATKCSSCGASLSDKK